MWNEQGGVVCRFCVVLGWVFLCGWFVCLVYWLFSFVCCCFVLFFFSCLYLSSSLCVFLSCSFVSKQQFLFLHSVICVDADMCANCFWVKMITINEKNTCTLIFCMPKMAAPATSLYWFEHLWHLFLAKFWKKTPTPVTHLLQVMLVDEYKGHKVQDVKKRIQKLMLDKVCDSVHTAASALSILSFSQDWVTRETPGVVLQPSGCFGLLQSTGHCRGRDLVFLGWVGWVA